MTTEVAVIRHAKAVSLEAPGVFARRRRAK
jgi:hypothetical protein